ncbi:Hint domain-containing protein, partial [Leptospira alexanderi]|uniref:Hint domain-containing protein n=1 Tax=Leptospira alexanderi TaxID=100053 RepID=UPI002014C970
TELFVHDINHLFDVEVNFQETFHTTWNHPFWLVNERAWVQVKDLKVGDIVLLKDGSAVPITKISAYSVSKTSVYNLEIEETHSYYVGKDGVLVHNYAIPLGARILHALVTAGIAYCSSNNCGGVINSNGNPNENKPELPALPRDPSLTQNEAEQMHRQGLNPMNSNDIQKYFEKISKDYKFASKEELAKRLNVNEKDIHIIKKEILKDFSIALTKNGMGTNPDIGWDTKGNLLLKDRTTGKVLNTYIPLEYYKD